MTLESVLLMAVWAFILLGVFFGDLGPREVFRRSGPRLGARIEKNIAVGYRFKDADSGKSIDWVAPPDTRQ